ncbi:MAG: gliding motility-associated C-terminal domain-containing protein [Flammeovirgaceae bacterium]
MCVKLSGNEPGLIGYWDFNEMGGSSVIDKSNKRADGVLIGNPTRVYSGAPVGDVSVYNYPGATTSISDGNLRLEASVISAGVEGLQLYEVKGSPSQTGGLDLSQNNSPYFGIFLATTNGIGSFTTKGFYGNSQTCNSFNRLDNSKPFWVRSVLPSNSQSLRAEYILLQGSLASFDLGPDKIVCDQQSFLLTTLLNDPAFSHVWNTGETTSSITINQSGTYSETVSGPCGAATDQVRVDFSQKPVFDLGAAVTLCDQSTYTLSSRLNSSTFRFLWSNGSTNPSIVVDRSGKYSVSVASICGVVTDEVQVDFLRTPRPFSLGDDEESCETPRVDLKPYGDASGFNYQWQDGSVSDFFRVTDFGKFWVSIKNGCGESADTIKFSKYNSKIGFVPNVITPNGDGKNDFFQVESKYNGLVSLTVLNRWGDQVYFSKNYESNWNGVGLSAGVYFFVLEGECVERFRGHVTIMH